MKRLSISIDRRANWDGKSEKAKEEEYEGYYSPRYGLYRMMQAAVIVYQTALRGQPLWDQEMERYLVDFMTQDTIRIIFEKGAISTRMIVRISRATYCTSHLDIRMVDAHKNVRYAVLLEDNEQQVEKLVVCDTRY